MTMLLTDQDIDTLASQAADWCIRRCPPSVGRDEIAQEARIAVWRASMTYDPDRGTALKTWCLLRAYGVVRNAINRRPEAKRVLVVLDVDHQAQTATTADVVDVERGLRELPADVREVLDLLYWRGMTIYEASDRLGISPTLLRRRRDRGLKTLRELLSRRETA